MGRSILAFIVMSGVLVLAGCVTASNNEAVQLQAKQLAPQLKPKDPRQARLYFIRPAGWMGQLGTVNFKLNGSEIGGIKHGSYLFVDRPPGAYTIEVVPPFEFVNNFRTDVEVTAGNTYFYAITLQGSTVATGTMFVRLDQENPGTPMKPKDGTGLENFRLNTMDAATGALEIAKLSNH